ncbi:MAG TPA: hypothetical protein PLS74_00430 [Bacteroidales bacterium]|nr:hypothetical protein [Bacteroidales bacterium]HPP93583.1 hypothetical protein [Bacteroidales bacterium]
MVKKILNQTIAGANLAPAIIIFLYLLFGVLDMFTTYMASSDLKYEGNWVVKKFDLNWISMIIYFSIIYLFVIVNTLFSLSCLEIFFKHNNFNSSENIFIQSFKNLKLLYIIISLGIFYSHFMSVGLTIFNNYLSHIYLHLNEESWLKNISVFYVNRQKYFLFFIQYIVVIPGYILAFMKVNKIRLRTIGKPHVD